MIAYKLLRLKRIIEKFIKWTYLNGIIQLKSYAKTRRLGYKIFVQIPLMFVEVSVTGWFIHYAITQFNWFSVGVAAALATHYVGWLIREIKRKE